MKELRELREGKHGVVMGLVPWVLTLMVVIGVLVMGILQHVKIEKIKEKLEKVEGELMIMRDLVYKDMSLQIERSRRAADSLSPSQYATDNPLKESNSEYSEEGVPVVGNNYRSFKKDGTGFRVYSAWYQHKRENQIKNDPRVVVKDVSDAPIRAHHRKSAAWSTNDQDFFEFGDTTYSDTSSGKIKDNSAPNSINYSRNRAKITNPKDYRNEHRPPPIPIAKTSPSTENSAKVLNDHMRNKMRSLNSTQSSLDRTEMMQERGRTGAGVSLQEKGAKNRAAVRSGVRRRRMRSRNGGDYRKNVRDAIHLEADVAGLDGPDYEGAGRVRVADSVFRNWTPSRWAKRMKMDKRLTLKDGRITVGSPGVYFVYAQINYLDNHDVNAFQIVVNDSPFILCTTMTHTPHPTTKANTCYTGGVKFLEQGDSIVIKNLEENRFSVMLPSHSFFGLVQLSDMGI